MRSYFVAAGCVGLLCLGCSEPTKRLNAPPHGAADEVSDLQAPLEYQVDNALLADMSVSDVHFLPHRAALSSLGEQRVNRLISLLREYGGAIRLSSDLEDAELLAARTAIVMERLTSAGIDTSKEVLREDMPGGRGMSAAEVVLIRASEGTYAPKKKTGSTSSSSSGSSTSAAK